MARIPINQAIQNVNIRTSDFPPSRTQLPRNTDSFTTPSLPKYLQSTPTRELQASQELQNWGGINVVFSQARLRIKFEKMFLNLFCGPIDLFNTDEIAKCLHEEVVSFPTDHFKNSLASLISRTCLFTLQDLSFQDSQTQLGQFKNVLLHLTSQYKKIDHLCQLINQSLGKDFRVCVRATVTNTLLSNWHKDLQNLLNHYVLIIAEKYFQQGQQAVEEEIQELTIISQMLSEMGEQYSNLMSQSLIQLYEQQLDERITSRSIDIDTQGLLNDTMTWFEKVVKPFSQIIQPSLDMQNYNLQVNQCFTEKVTSEILTLVAGGMQPSLQKEIQTTLKFVKNHDFFVENTIRQIKQKLLQIVQSTEKILQIYLKIIEVFKQIDPSTALLSKVVEPIKEYLKTERQDTLRCIVNMTLDPTQLMYRQLQQQRYTAATKPQNDAEDGYISTDDDEAAAEAWQPHPLSFGQLYISARRRRNDQISNLIDIYGTQEKFLMEYKQMLDKRLLTSLEDNHNQELKNIELVKLRFGENSLHLCEVMLRDITESNRLNKQLQQQLPKESQQLLPVNKIRVNIVTPNIWKQVIEEEKEQKQMKVPDELAQGFEDFQAIYKKAKPMRRLNYSETLGTVQLTLTFDDGVSQQFTVSPLQAIIISTFNKDPAAQQQVTHSLDDLALRLNLDNDSVLQALIFWSNCGVLRELPGQVYQSQSTRSNPNQMFTQQQIGQELKNQTGKLDNEDSFELEQQLVKIAREQIARVMSEFPNYSLKQVSLIIRNLPALKNISEDLVKDLYEQNQ